MADKIPPPTDQLAAVPLDNAGASSSTVHKPWSPSRTRIRSILGRPDGGAGLAGQKVQISGWVKKGRGQGKGTFAFLEVNDGSCAANLQVKVDASVSDLSKLVTTGTSLTIDGCLKIPPQGKATKQKIELSAEKVIDVGTVDQHGKTPYPIPKTKLTLEYLRDHTNFRARTTTMAAVTRIRHKICLAAHVFCDKHDICYIHTPIITTSDCEGAGEMFQVTTLINQSEKLEKDLVKNIELTEAEETLAKVEDRSKIKPGLLLPRKDGEIDYSQDFFARQAYLTVSGQLHAETYACSMGDVYTFGPTFRAEKSHTSRHLAEFWMVEVELAFAGVEEAMNCAEALVKDICKYLLEKCLDDMELMKNVDEACINRLQMIALTSFERVTYTKAITLLKEAVAKGKKFENQVERGIDLASEHERYLTEVLYKKPVIVYNYPKEIKAFYMRLNDDGETVAAFDVLVPKVGELIGGSQREERMDVLMERMEEKGLPIKEYEWYIDLRRHGTVKHSGFGLGLERMLLFATGMDNIRDVIPFPRYPGRADL
ncbi:unnamed protein product [Arabidopsis halleri]